MTTQQFSKILYGKNDKVIYKGKEYPILSIDFDNHLIGIEIQPQGIKEVHCEELTYIKMT